MPGCNFSKGTKKDLTTGLSYNYNGFSVNDVILIDAQNNKMNTNKVSLNTQIAVAAIGVANYSIKDGKAFPGMALIVTDKNGTPVINAADLFQGGEGYPPEKATELRGTISVGKPMESGQTYHVKLHIWDKVTPKNEINAEVNLVVM